MGASRNEAGGYHRRGHWARARRAEFLNELRELRRAVEALGDRVAADYLTHALICFVRGKDEAGEAWLRLTLDLLR